MPKRHIKWNWVSLGNLGVFFNARQRRSRSWRNWLDSKFIYYFNSWLNGRWHPMPDSRLFAEIPTSSFDSEKVARSRRTGLQLAKSTLSSASRSPAYDPILNIEHTPRRVLHVVYVTITINETGQLSLWMQFRHRLLWPKHLKLTRFIDLTAGKCVHRYDNPADPHFPLQPIRRVNHTALTLNCQPGDLQPGRNICPKRKWELFMVFA